jgi:hypothetical protein
MTFQLESRVLRFPGSLDGEGAGDHDQPFRFGYRPRASAPFPFSTRQYARLLILRSHVQDASGADGQADPGRCPCAAA